MKYLEKFINNKNKTYRPFPRNKIKLRKIMIPLLSLFLMFNTQNINSKTRTEKKSDEYNIEIVDYNINPELNINSSYSLGVSFGTNGLKLNANINLKTSYRDLDQDLGLGISYYTNFYHTQKKGLELRLSSLSTYNFNNDSNLSLGTNYWFGLGELKEFNQQTGIIKSDLKNFSFAFEQDGDPFYKLFLSDGCDRYRTSLLNFGFKNLDLNLKLFTGNRDLKSYDIERNILPNGRTGKSEGFGEFGEFYDNGFVYEKGQKYRYGALTLNYNNLEFGMNSEWIRHFFQNKIAHNVFADRRQFPMTNSDIKPVINYNSTKTSFSNW